MTPATKAPKPPVGAPLQPWPVPAPPAPQASKSTHAPTPGDGVKSTMPFGDGRGMMTEVQAGQSITGADDAQTPPTALLPIAQQAFNDAEKTRPDFSITLSV
jgi:hypothetical protein